MDDEITNSLVSEETTQEQNLSYEQQYRISGAALGEISIVTEQQVKANAVEVPETIQDEDTIEETLRKSGEMLVKNLEKMSLIELRKKTQEDITVAIKATKKASLSVEELIQIEAPLKGEDLVRGKQRGNIVTGYSSIFTFPRITSTTRHSVTEFPEKGRDSGVKILSEMLSTGQSGNIGIQSMSSCATSSNLLPRFEANAVLCVLQECLDYLSLLTYVIPAELNPCWNESYKTINELYGVPSEPQIIFREDLGLLPLIPSAAEKLQRDRYYAYCVLSDVTEELMRNGTYNSLQNTVDECVRTEEGEHLLQVNCQVLAEQVKQLYDLICSENIKNQESFAKCAETAVKLNAEVDSTIFLNGSKLAYLERWEAARLELHYCHMKMEEQKLDKQLTEYALMERMDEIVAGEVCTFLQASMKDMEDEIMVWTSQYNEEIERREQEINEFKEQLLEQKTILEQLYFVRDEQQQFIDECEAEMILAKEKAEYWKIIHRSATIIQSLWRGYIVRNQLGQFKGLWNVLSKRKKQAARARKKREAQQRRISEMKAKTNLKNPKNR